MYRRFRQVEVHKGQIFPGFKGSIQIMKFFCFLLKLFLAILLFKDITGRKPKKRKTQIKQRALVKKCSFKIDFDKNTFLKDGEPFRFISGDMHYFRISRCDWMDRFTKLKYAGLNTVAT